MLLILLFHNSVVYCSVDGCCFVKVLRPSFSCTLTLDCTEDNIVLQPHKFTTTAAFLNFSTSTYDTWAVLCVFLLPEYSSNIYLVIHLSSQTLAITCCLPGSMIKLHVFVNSARVWIESQTRYFTVTRNGDMRTKTVLQRYKVL
jgi:hypothetical protein